ncbi:MAG: 30S ribosomal protein S16 [Alphaproteobacteria bacterium]|nr:30S ribosomal protein S16 [Alphaproteobacteria bacterium]
MSLKIRLTRGGSKKRPYYRIVVAEVTAPRDGRFIEKLGSYNPMVERDHPGRLNLEIERVKHWLSVGAQPTDRVAKFLSDKGLMAAPVRRETPQQSAPRKKTQEKMKAAAAAAEANAAKAAAAAASEPAAS